MRFNSVVFPAPRNPVRTVIGVAVTSAARSSIDSCSGACDCRSSSESTWWSLLEKCADIDAHHLRHLQEIDLLRIGQFGEWFSIHVGRVVLVRIDLEITCQLLLLLLAGQLGLWNDPLTRVEWQGITE